MKRRINILRAILVVLILVAIKIRLNRLVSLLYLPRSEENDFIFPTEEKSFHFGKFKSGIDGIFESDQNDEFSGLYYSYYMTHILFRNIPFTWQ